MLPIAKYQILDAIHEKGVVAVIRASDKEKGLGVANAVYEGGIPAIEVAMTVPGALELMAFLAGHHRGSSLILGAGTVLDAPTARACILAGARYIISPNLSEEVAFCCNRYGVPYMPGVGSVTELVRAMELGVDVVKVFPGECLARVREGRPRPAAPRRHDATEACRRRTWKPGSRQAPLPWAWEAPSPRRAGARTIRRPSRRGGPCRGGKSPGFEKTARGGLERCRKSSLSENSCSVFPHRTTKCSSRRRASWPPSAGPRPTRRSPSPTTAKPWLS